jgi:hypothetical protein
LKTKIGSFEETSCHYKRHDPTRTYDSTSDTMLINFVPTSLTDSFEVMGHIQDDLIVGGMEFYGDLDDFID